MSYQLHEIFVFKSDLWVINLFLSSIANFFAAENFHEEVMHLPDPNIKESMGKDSQTRWRNLKNECLANSVGLTQALSQAVTVCFL